MLKLSPLSSVVEIMFQQTVVEIEEVMRAQFSVTFSPQDTEIPFNFTVETFDLSPPDAEGLLFHSTTCMVEYIKSIYSWY